MKSLKSIKRVITGNAIRRAAGLGLSLPLLLAGSAALAALDLGPAADFAVFQMGTTTSGGSWISAGVTINGDVGFLDTGPGGNHLTTVNGNVEGTITSSAFASKSWTVSGTYTQVPTSTLTDIADQARAFSAAAAAFTSLPSLGAVGNSTGSYTFTSANLAEPGTYIVNATSLALTGGNIFTLNGTMLPAGSRVIVNVANGFSLNGGSQINLNGLTPAQVLINYTSASSASITGGSGLFGTFLGPNSTASFTASGTIFGSVIAANVNLSSGLTINGMSFVPEPSACIAGALLLLPFGASALRIVRKR